MLPMQYVRKRPKGFGRNAQIEGHLEPGQRVLLVEDLTTDGRSKVNFCNALRDAGADPDRAVPGMRAHLIGCPACRDDHESLLEYVGHAGDYAAPTG